MKRKGWYLLPVLIIAVLFSGCAQKPPSVPPLPTTAPPSALAQTGGTEPSLVTIPITPPITTPKPENLESNPKLPSTGFIIEYTRSNLKRPVRELKEKYREPIIDTHAHLDPPSSGSISRGTLTEIIESIDNAGVDSIVIMPVPNEGIMGYGSLGAEQRKILREIGGDKIKIFCGSEYISNWLHEAYRNGHNESELNEVISRLSNDINGPEYSGVGEIALYHFNKDGRQNVIEYPPTFVPFLKIIGVIVEGGVWIDLHAEPVDPYSKSYEDQVFGGLELLFQKYPNLKLILSHTAMTNPTNARRILETYPNVMMNFKPVTEHNRWRNLEPITNPEGLLYNDWAELFEEMPGRFMVGTDMKFGRTPGDAVAKYSEDIEHMRRILGAINPNAAELIAYKNAERIFK